MSAAERDKCGLGSLFPMSCRDRAEAFARHLHSRLRSLGSEDGSSSADESSWLAAHEASIAVSHQPRHASDPDLFNFGMLESPGSPEEEIPESELSRLITNNKDNLNITNCENCHCPLKSPFQIPNSIKNACNDSDSSDGPYFDTESDGNQRVPKKCVNGLSSPESSHSGAEGTCRKQENCECEYALRSPLHKLQEKDEKVECCDSPVLSETTAPPQSWTLSEEESTLSLRDEDYPSLEYISTVQELLQNENNSAAEDVPQTNAFQIRKSRSADSVQVSSRNVNSINSNLYENGSNNRFDDESCSNKQNHHYASEDVTQNDLENLHNISQTETIVEADTRFDRKKEDSKTHDVVFTNSAKQNNDKETHTACFDKENGEEDINFSTLSLEKDLNIEEEEAHDTSSSVDNSLSNEEERRDSFDIGKILKNEGEKYSCSLNAEKDLKEKDETYVSSLNVEKDLTVECSVESVEVIECDITDCQEASPSYETQNLLKVNSTKIMDDDLDEDDDKDDKPQRVRRCSSLKTGKTPPGTPGRKKIVRFADVLGLDLADVRTFLDEIPKIPNSAYSDLANADLRTASSDSALNTIGTNFHPDAGHKPTKLLLPLFQQPGGQAEFLDMIKEKNVCLENAVVEDPIDISIAGTVRVKNLDFHKSVHIRYTLDAWKTYADLQATYLPNSCDGFSDKFSFVLYAHSLTIGQTLEFAVRFQCKGIQYWDNNYGANYCFQCLPATDHNSYLSTSPLHSDDSWSSGFY